MHYTNSVTRQLTEHHSSSKVSLCQRKKRIYDLFLFFLSFLFLFCPRHRTKSSLLDTTTIALEMGASSSKNEEKQDLAPPVKVKVCTPVCVKKEVCRCVHVCMFCSCGSAHGRRGRSVSIVSGQRRSKKAATSTATKAMKIATMTMTVMIMIMDDDDDGDDVGDNNNDMGDSGSFLS